VKHRTSVKRRTLSLSLCVAVGVAGAVAAAGLAARAADPAARPVSPAGPAVVHRPTSGGAGASQAAGDARPPLPLEDKPFERPSAGISVRPPKGWTGLVEADREEIVRFVDDVKKQDWSLVVTRQTFNDPHKLMGAKDAKGEFVPGVVENTLASFKTAYPGAKVLRGGDPTNVGAHDVGVIILRYTSNGERRLAQHAIIEGNDQLFYLVALNSPARKDVTEDAAEEEKTVDPAERQAIETFRTILDSVKLLDLRAVREDQTQRLFRTRGLFANLTDKRLTAVLVPERYLRVVKNGQDVGYSYVVEQLGRVNRRGTADGTSDGISVGIRTRIMTGAPAEVPGAAGVKIPPYPREDSESWMFFAMDRRNEDWSKITVWDDGTPKTPQNPWRKVSEVGSSQRQTRRVASVKPVDAEHPERRFEKGEGRDLNQPWVQNLDSYTLNVQFKATRGDLPPVTNPLPPFYLPQGLATLLPRLLPATEPKSYMFATYVSELRQVMARYVDVRREEPLPPELLRARGPAGGNGAGGAAAGMPAGAGAPAVARGIPIDDKLGYEGAVTTHWVTPGGEYLGSVTRTSQYVGGVGKATVTVVAPTDEATLKKIWGVADADNLRDLPPGSVQEGEVNRTGGGPAGPPSPVGRGFVNPTGPGTPTGPGGGLPGSIGPGR
jgi:hypothetical protein